MHGSADPAEIVEDDLARLGGELRGDLVEALVSLAV